MVSEARQQIKAGSVPAVAVLLLWIKACEKQKDPTLAYALYKYLVQHYGLPGRTWLLQSDVCNSLLGAFCKGGRPEMAVAFFWHLFEVGVQPTSTGVCLAISAFVKTGAYAEAKVWFNKLHNSGSIPNMTAYNAIISGCARDGSDLDVALEYLSMMLDDGLEPSTITYNALIKCAHKEDPALLRHPFDAAAVLVRKLVERQIDETAILFIASRYAGYNPSHRKKTQPATPEKASKPFKHSSGHRAWAHVHIADDRE
eukprot:1199798-Amphidinium_carterae.1